MDDGLKIFLQCLIGFVIGGALAVFGPFGISKGVYAFVAAAVALILTKVICHFAFERYELGRDAYNSDGSQKVYTVANIAAIIAAVMAFLSIL